MPNNQTHHMQTPEGKQASIEGRRRREADLPSKDTPRVFVVRLAGSRPFGWETRRNSGWGHPQMSRFGKSSSDIPGILALMPSTTVRACRV